jgi:hypothetical protein
VLDIVTADENKPPARVNAGVVDDGEPRLAAARSRATQATGAEAAHRPGSGADQAKNDEECQEEAYGKRHVRAEQSFQHPPFSP